MFRRERPPEDLIRYAQSCEQLGLHELWIVEDCFWSGGLTAVTAALAATERITVGMGIMPAVARNAAITAMELAGLARLFPDRFVAGFGHGVGSWMHQIGAVPVSQLAALEETVDAVRRLLSGERLTVDGAHVRLSDVQLVFPPAPRPPVVLGVTGPKGLDVAARAADGLVLPEGSSPAYIGAALERAGRPKWCAVYVLLAVDDDGDAARERVRRAVDEFAPGPLDQRLAALGVDELVEPADRADRYAVAGTPAQCARAIERIVAAGATSVVFVPQPLDHEAQLDRVVREVFPLVR